MMVKDLKVKTAVDEITLQILELKEPRAFNGQNGPGTVCNARAKDESDDEITLTLWNDDASRFKVDDIVKLTNGWVTEYKGKLQISTGKSGKIELDK